MKKRAKTSFSSNSRNILWALLIVAAAVTVYGIAQAASVSHTPADIQPQGAGSGLDSDLLQGLGSADILAQGGGGKELITWGTATNEGYYSSGWVMPATPAAGTGAPSCPAGWTQAYAGYGPYYRYIYTGGGSSGYTPSTTLTVAPVCGASANQYFDVSLGGSGYLSYSSAGACGSMSSGTPPTTNCNTCRVCVK